MLSFRTDEKIGLVIDFVRLDRNLSGCPVQPDKYSFLECNSGIVLTRKVVAGGDAYQARVAGCLQRNQEESESNVLS